MVDREEGRLEGSAPQGRGPVSDGAASAPRLDCAALKNFLEQEGVESAGTLRASLITGGKSNLTYRISDDNGPRWVLRRPPTAGLTPSAHDMGREFRVANALLPTGVPVAPAIALCEEDTTIGAPFALVEFVRGRVLRTRQELEPLTGAQVQRCVGELIRVLAVLHEVDYSSVSLSGLGRPDNYLERQVALWARQWNRVKTEELPDLDRLQERLARSIPRASAHSIVHGDYRIDNVMLDHADAGRVRAVMDWELSTLGDPLADVAMMCVYRQPGLDRVLGEPAAWNSDRIPSCDDLAEHYASVSGRELANWGFYLGLANLKLAVIAQGIEYRNLKGAAGGGRDRAGEAVAQYVATGLRALEGHRWPTSIGNQP